jgi:hypothetical protein
MKKESCQFSANVNDGKTVKSLSRFELAKELFLEITNNGERNFYSIKHYINDKLEDEGKKGLSEDDLLDVVHMCGWDI